MSDDNEFEVGDAGVSNTELVDAGRRKIGSLVMMKIVKPCRVTAFATAKPGKHGSAKAMITAKDIFTDRQYEETFGTGDMIPAPVVTKIDYTCLDFDEDGTLMLLDEAGEMKEDMNLPTEAHLKDVVKTLKKILEEGKKECTVTVQTWGDLSIVINAREGNEM